MAFRKVLALALLGMAASAPQQLHFVQNGFRSVAAAPVATHSFVRAAPQVVHTTSHAAPVQQVVRTVSAATPVVSHVSHAVAQPTFVRQVNAVEHVAVEQVDDPNYSFGYSVADTRSGDSKTREEHAENGVVSGSYSVADPDGRIRTVEYTADAEHGFQATVSYDGDVNAPPAIPFDAPAATTTTVAASAPVQVIDARNNVATHAVHTVAQPATVVRTAANTHAVHNLVQQPTVVRAAATHAVHNVAQPTFVRAAQPVFHSVAAQPTFVRAVAQPQFVRTVSAQPAATHVSHSNGVVSGFRTVSSPFATTQLVHA